MSIELLINRQPAGTFTVSREGLYTVFEAAAPKAAGLVRLWVHGSGRSAYLGLMQPTDGGLFLRRRLSRRELAAFPEPIELVSDREREESDTNDLHNNVDINCIPASGTADTGDTAAEEAAATERDAAPAGPDTAAPEAEAAELGQGVHNETSCRACPWPADPPEEGLLWYSRGDGSLTAFDGISSLLALPAELRAGEAHTVERVIEGKKYLVFRY